MEEVRRSRRRLILTSTVVLALCVGACATPLDRTEVLAQVSAACDEFEFAPAGDPGGSGPDGLPAVLGLSTARNALSQDEADPVVTEELEPLEDALTRLMNATDGMYSRLSNEDYFEYEKEVVEARDAERDLASTASAAGVPECAPPEIAESIDAAEARLAERAAATAPSGDYRTDLEAACTEFAEGATEAVINREPGAVGAIGAAASLAGLYDQLQRRLERLDPGELADEHDALLELAEQAGDLAGDLDPYSDTQEELDAISAELEEVTDEAEQLISETGVDCNL